MEHKESIVSVAKGKYKFKSQSILVEGILDVNSSGNAYVITDDFEQQTEQGTSDINAATSALSFLSN